MNCIFCNLPDKEIFYEDKYYIAVYNIKPFVHGHSLIIPRRHVESFMDLNAEEAQDMIGFMKKVLFIVLKFAETKDFDLIMQEGRSAGQSIRHLHVHILPRKEKDKVEQSKGGWLGSFKEYETKAKPLSEEEFLRTVKELRRIAEENRDILNKI